MESTVGSLVGDRYELVKPLSITTMSRVFKAWDHQQEHFVVVKITTNSSEHYGLVERLKREAIALKRLDHPRVVHLLDSGDVEESYFVVLEYIHGMNLAACLYTTYLLPLDTAISIEVDMLEGLEAIHKEGLVHRDLKPENLMATRVGIKIIDFGLVKFVSAADRQMKQLTNPGTVFGTPQYLSPEQALGLSDVDARSDLYTCGVILYELLTGVLPFYKIFEGGRLIRRWDLPMRPFSSIWPSVHAPIKVQDIVWKALQANPANRYQTAEEMRMDLLAVLGSYSKIIVP